jgi:hypothetical protein
MKNRNLLITAAFVITLSIIPACDILEECGTCVWTTEDADGNIVDEGVPQPVCGDNLYEKENAAPETIDGLTYYWNCY